MMKKTLVVALLASLVLTNAAQAESSAAKKELVAKVLRLQQPVIEMTARNLAEQPAAQMMQLAGMDLQRRIPADQREAVGKEIRADLTKYLEDIVPKVMAQAVKVAPLTIGPLIEDNFSEEELRQLIEIIESPVNRKYSQLGGDLQKALTTRLIADTQAMVMPKVQALQASISGRLGVKPVPASKTPVSPKQ